MINPYELLKISQNADKKDIQKAQIIAMKEKRFSIQEIHIASRQLLNPAKRLAADFMFPSKIKAMRPKKIFVDIQIKQIDFNDIDENTFDSIK